MKATNHFTRTILTYLEQRAGTDSLFAEYFVRTDKNIDDCIQYILQTVQKSGCNGFEDSEIFGLAIDFYTETDIEIGNPVNCKVVVNHVVQLTESEIEEAKKEAIQKAQEDAYNKMMQPKKKAKQVALNPQPSLFDF